MAYLLLDLDLTVFATNRDIQCVHQGVLKKLAGKALTKFDQLQKEEEIHILNPEQLSDLINYATHKHDGIIIFTAGLWDEQSIKSVLTQHLDLTEDAETKIHQCLFVTPISYFTEEKIDFDNVMKVRDLNKNTRLTKYLSDNPSLNHKHFVMLDDNEEHIKSFSKNEQVISILATHETGCIKFYQSAKDALDSASLNEVDDLKNGKKRPAPFGFPSFFPASPKKIKVGSESESNCNLYSFETLDF